MVSASGRKGILSEHLIDVFGIIISVFLIFLIGISLFTRQAESGTESAYMSMARQIASAVDRVAAEAGSARIEFTMTRGLPVDVSVGSRDVILSWGGEKKAGASFSAPTGLEMQEIKNPATLCIVKSRNDRRIVVQSGICKCMTGDQRCDASCVVDGICDPACVRGEKDYVCLPACSKGGDSVCDPDCVSSVEDWSWDTDCALADGICDPDSNRLNDGVCDPDCLMNGTDGICDPECISSRDANKDGIEDVKDGVCDLDCLSSGSVGVSSTSIKQNVTCDPKNANHWQCVGNDLYQCGTYFGSCMGGCGQPSENQTVTAGCHVAATPNFNSSASASCCCRADGTCKKDSRLTCILGGGYAFAEDSQYCKGSSTDTIKIFPLKDGICDLDCADRTDVCDPDCPEHLSQCSPCAAEGEAAAGKPCCSGLTQCPSSGLCMNSCCGNGACEARAQWNESMHPKNWENPCTCPSDCPGTCPRLDSCSSGNFTSGICYTDLMGSFYGSKIEVCSDAVKDFLDRRMWDINEVAATTLRVGPPLGWGFDDTRYCGDSCGRLQSATTTIAANEAYISSEPVGCCQSMVQQRGCACNSAFHDETACGIGFCGDHSTAMYSILQRIGIPSKDLWVTYVISGSECRPHAFVIMRCNTSLESRLLLSECTGRNGQWLAMDATGHFIKPMGEIGCRTMCLWWNENGFYAQQEGRISPTEGWAYNQSAKCSPSTWEGKEYCEATDGTKLPCQFNDYCEKNALSCQDFCKEAGITCKW